ncbi:MAG TPA: hypothetical protein ENH82_00755 [bacterium]|nr:hypothetical protein [bacterium]
MPTVKIRVMKTEVKDGKFFCVLALNKKMPRVGEYGTLKWGAKRSLAQNAFLWVFYSWLINEAGLKEQGHFSPQALHDNLKAHFLSEKIMSRGQFKAIEELEELTTTLMNKVEFSDYFTKVDTFMQEFFGIDSKPFFDEHKANFQ